MNLLESEGIYIDGGWLAFVILSAVFLCLLIYKRIREQHRAIDEIESELANTKGLIATNDLLALMDPEQLEIELALLQSDKLDRSETPLPERESRGASGSRVKSSAGR